jgi:hypothetical protein
MIAPETGVNGRWAGIGQWVISTPGPLFDCSRSGDVIIAEIFV